MGCGDEREIVGGREDGRKDSGRKDLGRKEGRILKYGRINILMLTGILVMPVLVSAQIKRKVLYSYNVLYGFSYPIHDEAFSMGSPMGGFELLTTITTGGSGTIMWTRGNHSADGHIYYSHIIPSKVVVHDSIYGKVTGWNFGMTAVGRDLFFFSKRMDLVLSLGINAGQVRLYGNDLIKQKNPYFAPSIALEPKIRIGRITLVGLIEYSYDLGSSRWRETWFGPSADYPISRFVYTGYNFMLGIGYCPNGHPSNQD